MSSALFLQNTNEINRIKVEPNSEELAKYNEKFLRKISHKIHNNFHNFTSVSEYIEFKHKLEPDALKEIQLTERNVFLKLEKNKK